MILTYTCRAVASLTIPSGQKFHFLIFPQISDQFFLIFLKFVSFSSSLWLSGWASCPPGKALATLLYTCTLTKVIAVLMASCTFFSNHIFRKLLNSYSKLKLSILSKRRNIKQIWPNIYQHLMEYGDILSGIIMHLTAYPVCLMRLDCSASRVLACHGIAAYVR